MIDFKKCMVLVVLLLLISALTSTLILAQDSNEIPFDRLKTPTELQDIIDTFDSLKYNFKAFNDGEKAQDMMVEFQIQGEEEVEGVQADKLLIKYSTMKTSKISQMKFWLDNGEIIKMVQGGQEIPVVMVDTMKNKMLELFFIPFYYFERLNMEEIVSEGEVTSSQKMIGESKEKEVDIFKIKGNNLAKYELKSGTMELADFDKSLIMVSFDYITLDEVEAKYEKGQFEIKEIELR